MSGAPKGMGYNKDSINTVRAWIFVGFIVMGETMSPFLSNVCLEACTALNNLPRHLTHIDTMK